MEQLRAYFSSLGIFTEIEDGKEPPDFVLKAGMEKWAVEVTELHQEDENGKSRASIWPAGQKVAALVRKKLAGGDREYLSFIQFDRHVTRKEVVEVANAAVPAILSGRLYEKIQIWDGVHVFNQQGASEIQITSLVSYEDLESYWWPALKKSLPSKVESLKRLVTEKGEYQKVFLLIHFFSSDVSFCSGLVNMLAKEKFDCKGVQVVLSPLHQLHKECFYP